MAAADTQNTNAVGTSAAKPEPIADLWDLIARTVSFEQIGLATWWLVAVESTGDNTDLGVVHLDNDRTLTCRWSKDGARIIGDHEASFRRRVAGILANFQAGV